MPNSWSFRDLSAQNVVCVTPEQLAAGPVDLDTAGLLSTDRWRTVSRALQSKFGGPILPAVLYELPVRSAKFEYQLSELRTVCAPCQQQLAACEHGGMCSWGSMTAASVQAAASKQCCSLA